MDNKIAIVTGGNSGIGRAIVLALARVGASITIDYVVKPEAAEALEDHILDLGEQATMVEADVSQVADLQMLIDRTVNAFGRLDIMIKNAGIETRTSLLKTSEDDYDKTMAVNLKSAFFGTQLAARQMIKQGHGGRIINMSSVHEDWPMSGNAAYCCPKGGMRMLTRTAALDLAEHGITMVGVGPGAVATSMNQETMSDLEKLQKLKSTIPLNRMAKPEEIAELVVWLASDQAGYVTATTYFIDGGMMHSSPGL